MATRRTSPRAAAVDPVEPEAVAVDEVEEARAARLAKATYGSIPYFIDGVRVTRAEFAAHEKQVARAAALDELDQIAADEAGETTTTNPSAESADSTKE